MNVNKIIIGSDHAGYDLKKLLKTQLSDMGVECEDVGTHSLDSVDYPDFAHPLAEAVGSGRYKMGILICGSANGVSMSANKHQDVRAAICWTREIAVLAREHNNANVVCLPARFITEEEALDIVKAFLTTEFEGGRHERRVGKIACA